ncbi:MAG TPA: Uma2 family endonuclease [Candidatus Elarobacter sp.]|jgi:Uma2 family endonuclease
MSLHEIILPITKPETEWVRGRALQKTGGSYAHSAVQMGFAIVLHRWAHHGGYGRVAPSWRFRVAPRSGFVRPLAPDVAYLSYGALPSDAPADAIQVPLGAPTLAVEVLCEDDLAADIDDKVVTYLSAGSAAVVLADPDRATVAVHDARGICLLRTGHTLTHPALPGFALDVGALFARAKG